MASKKANGYYLARVRIDGTRVSRTFPTKALAQAWEKQMREGDAHVDSPTVGQFFMNAVDVIYEDKASLESSRSRARRLIKIIGEDTKMHELSPRVVTIIEEGLRSRKIADGTHNVYASVFNKIMQRAQKLGLVFETLTMGHKALRNQRERILSEDEEERALGVLSPKDARLFTFLLYSGLRWSEAYNLRREDYHNGNITLWETKDGKERTIPLPQKAQAALEAALEEGQQHPMRMPYHAFLARLKRRLKRAGIEGVTPHTLRHTVASRLAQRGVDAWRMKDFMGHSSIQMTMRYVHLNTAALNDAAAALND